MDAIILYSTCIDGAEALATAIARQSHYQATILPLTDGGRGFIAAAQAMNSDATVATTKVRNQQLAPIEAQYLVSADGKTAFIEAAATVSASEPCPPALSFSHGVGDLIIAAIERGCRNLIIGVEGLPTIDGGLGMLSALGYTVTTPAGDKMPIYRGSEMLRAGGIIDSPIAATLCRCRFTVACNDDSAFYASTGPAVRYARQLGANEVTTDILDNGLRHISSVFFKHNGRDVSYIRSGGAGGGLAGALASFFNARLLPAPEVLPGNALAKALRQAGTIIAICDQINPTIASGLAFGSILSAKKKSRATLQVMARQITDAPLLQSMGIDHLQLLQN